jgi:hypothetical protein
VRTPLVDDVLLVHLHPRSGRGLVDPGKMTTLLVGALLLELVAGERLRRRPHETRKHVHLLEVVDDRPTGDPELDAVLQQVAVRTRTTDQMLGVRSRGLRRRIGDRLLHAGRVSEGTGLLPGRRLVPSGDASEAALRADIAKAAVSGDFTSTRAMQVLFLAGTQRCAHRAARVRRRAVTPRAVELGGPEWVRRAMTPSSLDGGTSWDGGGLAD